MKCDVAVAGGGIFGVTAAIVLARSGHQVTLFEQRSELLCAASGINQLRLHAGYHYPRSVATALASRDAVESFRAMYPGAVVESDEHYYAIAREGTLTSGDEFLEFLARLELEHRPARPSFVREEAVDVCVAVREHLIDLPALRDLVWAYLRSAGVHVHLGTRATAGESRVVRSRRRRDVFNAERADRRARRAVSAVSVRGRREAVRRPADSLRDRSVVVLDGPFMCIDPYGRSGFSLMGHVVHAIHHSNVGELPEIPDDIEPLLNQGVIERPRPTAFSRFVEEAVAFIPDAAKMEHVGSMYTVRTVLPGLDRTDARPTVVARHGARIVALFSGKIGTCVRAAEEVAEVAEGIPDQVVSMPLDDA